jgi:anti-anti-sigma factor
MEQEHFSQDGTTTFILSGPMTFADLNNMRDIIAAFQEPGVKSCVLDLGAVDFIDSTALGMLLLAREAAIGKGVAISIKNMRHQVRRVMEAARFDQLFTIACTPPVKQGLFNFSLE